MKSKLLVLVLCMTYSCGTQLVAVEDTTIRTSIRSIGFGADVGLVYTSDSESAESFSVQSFTVGEAFDYVGPAKATFYGSPFLAPVHAEAVDIFDPIVTAPAPQVETDSEQRIVPIAQVQLNPAWKQTLLIWVGRGEGYGILAIPDDDSDFPVDHVRFINLSSSRIGILTTDDEKKLTLPKDDWIISATGREAIYFTAILEDGEGGHTQLNNVVEMRSGVRRTVIFAVTNFAAMGGDPAGRPQFSYFTLTER